MNKLKYLLIFVIIYLIFRYIYIYHYNEHFIEHGTALATPTCYVFIIYESNTGAVGRLTSERLSYPSNLLVYNTRTPNAWVPSNGTVVNDHTVLINFSSTSGNGTNASFPMVNPSLLATNNSSTSTSSQPAPPAAPNAPIVYYTATIGNPITLPPNPNNTPISAQYIRLTPPIKYYGSGYNVGDYNIILKQVFVMSNGMNIAWNKPVYCTTTYGQQQCHTMVNGNYAPANSNLGFNMYWQGLNTSGYDFIEINLGTVYPIDSVRVLYPYNFSTANSAAGNDRITGTMVTLSNSTTITSAATSYFDANVVRSTYVDNPYTSTTYLSYTSSTTSSLPVEVIVPLCPNTNAAFAPTMPTTISSSPISGQYITILPTLYSTSSLANTTMVLSLSQVVIMSGGVNVAALSTTKIYASSSGSGGLPIFSIIDGTTTARDGPYNVWTSNMTENTGYQVPFNPPFIEIKLDRVYPISSIQLIFPKNNLYYSNTGLTIQNASTFVYSQNLGNPDLMTGTRVFISNAANAITNITKLAGHPSASNGGIIIPATYYTNYSPIIQINVPNETLNQTLIINKTGQYILIKPPNSANTKSLSFSQIIINGTITNGVITIPNITAPTGSTQNFPMIYASSTSTSGLPIFSVIDKTTTARTTVNSWSSNDTTPFIEINLGSSILISTLQIIYPSNLSTSPDLISGTQIFINNTSNLSVPSNYYSTYSPTYQVNLSTNSLNQTLTTVVNNIPVTGQYILIKPPGSVTSVSGFSLNQIIAKSNNVNIAKGCLLYTSDGAENKMKTTNNSEINPSGATLVNLTSCISVVNGSTTNFPSSGSWSNKTAGTLYFEVNLGYSYPIDSVQLIFPSSYSSIIGTSVTISNTSFGTTGTTAATMGDALSYYTQQITLGNNPGQGKFLTPITWPGTSSAPYSPTIQVNTGNYIGQFIRIACPINQTNITVNSNFGGSGTLGFNSSSSAGGLLELCQIMVMSGGTNIAVGKQIYASSIYGADPTILVSGNPNPSRTTWSCASCSADLTTTTVPTFVEINLGQQYPISSVTVVGSSVTPGDNRMNIIKIQINNSTTIDAYNYFNSSKPNSEVYYSGPDTLSVSQAIAKCDSYGGILATFNQLQAAVSSGASWTQLGWINHPVYRWYDVAYPEPTTCSGTNTSVWSEGINGPNMVCGLGNQASSATDTASTRRAGAVCFGPKPKKTPDTLILPFSKVTNNWSAPYVTKLLTVEVNQSSSMTTSPSGTLMSGVMTPILCNAAACNVNCNLNYTPSGSCYLVPK
jgi:hypothetical protein